MGIAFFKKIIFDKEYLLFELLKLKKSLEIEFLNQSYKPKPKSVKFKFRSFLLTKNISFFFNSNNLELIELIECLLKRRFSKFKRKGVKIQIENINDNNENNIPEFFSNLVSFNTLLEKVDSNLIVQGSYSDNTFLSYSDLDLVIIGHLSKEVIKIKEAIEKELIKIDPLQHHGVFFINKNSYANYWQADLPIETLKKALYFSHKRKLEIVLDNVFSEKYSSYYFILSFINNYKNFPLKLDSGAFFAKYFVSQLLLLPALLLAFKGNYIYKRESFSLAKNLYSVEAWRTIEIASKIRSQWNQKEISNSYVETRKKIANKKVKEYNILKSVIELNDVELQGIHESYVLFLSETRGLIKEK